MRVARRWLPGSRNEFRSRFRVSEPNPGGEKRIHQFQFFVVWPPRQASSRQRCCRFRRSAFREPESTGGRSVRRFAPRQKTSHLALTWFEPRLDGYEFVFASQHCDVKPCNPGLFVGYSASRRRFPYVVRQE